MGLFSNNKAKSDIVPEPPQPEKVAVPSSPIASEKINEPITQKPTITTTTNQQSKMSENLTTISTGTNLEGIMKLEGDVQIDGTIKGSIFCKGKVSIGPGGKVDGDVNCQEAEVSGKIAGKINVNDMLFLKGNALIDGDINTGKLVMESGVRFNGKCNMGAKNAAATAPSASNGAISNGVPAGAKVNA
jgi:cytoskeletal protein CcmA (bactofilin family)